MQKKLIALAVAGLASTAAFAQSNVTIYGLIDYGYSYRFDARGADSLVNGVSLNKPNSNSRLDSGIAAGNRLGFKGTEDLGNGLKAVFLAEMGFASDTGYSAQDSRLFGRQIYAGLSGNFGTAVGGRLYTPYYTMMLQYDPFINGTVGAYSNVWTPGTGSNASNTTIGAIASYMNPLRVDNAIAYISPSFGGFTVTGAFSNNADQQDSTNNNARNNTVYAIAGNYAGGALTGGANYHAIQAGTGISQLKNIQNFTLGLGYDFKVVKVTGVYSWNEADFDIQNFNKATLNNYLLGATAPFGKFTVKGSYIYSDGNKQAGGDAQQLALGLDYNLSKRTNLYTAYSWIDNSDKRLSGVGDASNTGSYSSQFGNGMAQPGGVWQQGFQVGLKHMF